MHPFCVEIPQQGLDDLRARLTSPVGQLAWIIEELREWTDSDKLPEDAIDRARLLANATLYWLAGTAGSSAPPQPLPPVPVPIGVGVYPHDIAQPIRRFAERRIPNIVHWNELERGGHLAAMEEPDLFVDNLWAFRRTIQAQ